jgi:acyl-coenzyme A thioesterase PaaI-like protein
MGSAAFGQVAEERLQPGELVAPEAEDGGASLAAMLYDTVGPALLATVDPDEFHSTMQLSVQFLRPARPGQLTAHGRIVHRQGDIAALDASLHKRR